MPTYTGTADFGPDVGTAACALPRICGTGGHRKWNMRRGKDGNREYQLKYRVEVDPSMGPGAALFAAGLPVPGSVWNFGLPEYDLWAFCTQEVSVDQVLEEGPPNNFFDLTYTFTTAPQETYFTDWLGDPVLLPQKVSGNFVRYSEEASNDQFGNPILSSSWERITGPKVEFDANRPQIHIEFWDNDLDLTLLSQYIDGVNATPLWGFAARCVKFSACSWQKMFRGNCGVVFHKVMEFDVNTNTFDRDILDEGTKVLHGEWDRLTASWKVKPIGQDASGNYVWPDPLNPSHFIRFPDPQGNVTRIILNGRGVPWNPDNYTSGSASAGTSDDQKGYIHVEKYPDRDLTLLGIPLSLTDPC